MCVPENAWMVLSKTQGSPALKTRHQLTLTFPQRDTCYHQPLTEESLLPVYTQSGREQRKKIKKYTPDNCTAVQAGPIVYT